MVGSWGGCEQWGLEWEVLEELNEKVIFVRKCYAGIDEEEKTDA